MYSSSYRRAEPRRAGSALFRDRAVANPCARIAARFRPVKNRLQYAGQHHPLHHDGHPCSRLYLSMYDIAERKAFADTVLWSLEQTPNASIPRRKQKAGMQNSILSSQPSPYISGSYYSMNGISLLPIRAWFFCKRCSGKDIEKKASKKRSRARYGSAAIALHRLIRS